MVAGGALNTDGANADAKLDCCEKVGWKAVWVAGEWFIWRDAARFVFVGAGDRCCAANRLKSAAQLLLLLDMGAVICCMGLEKLRGAATCAGATCAKGRDGVSLVAGSLSKPGRAEAPPMNAPKSFCCVCAGCSGEERKVCDCNGLKLKC